MSIIIKGITKAQFYKDTNKIPYMDVGWDIEELPPHGRVIDADVLDTEILQDGFSYALTRRKLRYTPGDVRQKIANAPTILDSDNNVLCKEEEKE